MVTLFHGKNPYLSLIMAHRQFDDRKQQLIDNSITYETFTLDASTTPAESIMNEIETPSFFSQHKLIFIKRPSQSSEKETLHRCILEHAQPQRDGEGLDLILWEDSKLAKNLKFIKKLSETKSIVESPELNKRTFRTWAQKESLAEGLHMSSDTLFLLSERTNYNPESFHREIGKLKLTGKDVITEEDIELYCPDTLEHTVWQLIDAVNAGDTVTAEKHLESTLRQGNDPHYLLLMLSRNLRLTLLTKLLLNQGCNTYDIARKIKAPPFTIAAIQSNARSMDLKRISTLYEKLTNIDYSEKTGQLDISLALHILLSVI